MRTGDNFMNDIYYIMICYILMLKQLNTFVKNINYNNQSSFNIHSKIK